MLNFGSICAMITSYRLAIPKDIVGATGTRSKMINGT